MKVWQLKQKQSLPLKVKIEMSKRRIYNWLVYFDGKAYISYSGGVDSEVLRHIALQVDSSLKSVFCSAMQFAEIKKHVKRKEQVDFIYSDMKPKEIFEKFGYPVPTKEQAQYIYEYRNSNSEKLKKKRWEGDEKGRYKISECWKFLVDAPFKISKKCCDVIKKKPFIRYEKENDVTCILGTMVEESRGRLNSYIRYGCNVYHENGNGRPKCRPLSFWTKSDILKYIKENKLDYCNEIYGNIVKGKKGRYYTTKRQRTGCIFCGFGVHMEKAPNRIQKLGKTHPKLYEYLINELGFGKVYEYMGVEYKVR